MYGLQFLLAILDVVTVYVQIVNFWQNIWHPRLVYCRIFDIRYWTIAECLTSKVGLLENIWHKRLVYCRIFDNRYCYIAEYLTSEVGLLQNAAISLECHATAFAVPVATFEQSIRKKGACLLVKYQRRLTQMDPLFIVHSFFARKQIKQVCQLQVQTMQDLYRQEAMPTLKIRLIKSLQQNPSHGVYHRNPTSFVNILMHVPHLNLLCVYISHLSHI